ncbi:hypothetical protein J6590_029851 [Homalodisca vitripennis]|nr:hypothetical protein J6590_029851 [Homalodisca vitripennis]
MSLASCDLYRIRSYYAVLPTRRPERFNSNGLDHAMLARCAALRAACSFRKKITRACKVQAQIKRRAFISDKIRRKTENTETIARLTTGPINKMNGAGVNQDGLCRAVPNVYLWEGRVGVTILVTTYLSPIN